MVLKVFVFLALGAVVSAGPVPQQYHDSEPQHQYSAYHPHVDVHVAQPQQQHKLIHHEPEPYDHNPKYNFSYDVHDHLTYDAKSQTESRDGDVVQGEYSVHDPDGFLRTVKYTVDPHSGFQAVVNRTPLEHKGHVSSDLSHYAHPQHYQH